MGACCERIARFAIPFGRTFVIALPTVLISRFRSFAVILPTEAARCEGVITECEVRDALKLVGLNKSPGLDGLPNEAYLRLPHMFVPILTDMFNDCFSQGAIPGSVTKCTITLLKKGGKHVWEGLDYYRPITLLNAELKILARILANRLQLVISDLIGPKQTYCEGKILLILYRLAVLPLPKARRLELKRSLSRLL